MLDLIMLNGDIGEKLLMKMDKYIRGRVDELLKVRSLPGNVIMHRGEGEDHHTRVW
jgi:hypothetical protein